jgi:ribosomal protein L13E
MQRPVVTGKVRGAMKSREGRGYSLSELHEIGLDGFEAIRRGIPFDKFRDTKHEENVQKLKAILEQK